jgi:hypothetical protein
MDSVLATLATPIFSIIDLVLDMPVPTLAIFSAAGIGILALVVNL